jgi:hypothetical protein
MQRLFCNFLNFNKHKVNLFLTLLIMLSSINLFSNDYNLKIKSNKDTVEIGDKIILDILSKFPKSSKNFKVTSEDSTDRYSILKLLKLDTIIDKNFVTLKGRVEFYNYNLENVIIKPIKINYDVEDSINLFLKSNSIKIINKLQNADTSKAFKDIKPVIDVDFDYSQYILYFFLVVIILLLLYFVYKYLNNKKPIENLIENVTPKIPANLLALEALKALENELLWQKGNTKAYYTRLSEILKIYIENYFRIDCLELTTNELLVILNSSNINKDYIMKLQIILVTSDMVKFAKYESNSNENINLMKSAFDFVESTSNLNKNVNENNINTDKK